MEEVFGKENILYSKGCDILGEENYIDDEVKIAEMADVVVCVIGDCLAQNGEYRDRADLELSGYHSELAKRLIDTKKPRIILGKLQTALHIVPKRKLQCNYRGL